MTATTATAPTPVNQNAPTGTPGPQGVHTPRMLSGEAQHVIDSLEAHLGAVTKAAASGNPALTAGVAKFADDALGLLESWGASLRVKLQAAESESPGTAAAVGSLDTEAGLGAASPAPAAPAAAATA